MNYSFLDSYKIPSGVLEVEKAKSIGRLRHYFFALPEIQIQEALTTFNPFPEELKKFYLEIGFGFMHRKKGEVNTILDPLSLIYTNMQTNYFATPAISKELSYYDIEKQLLFFKTNSNQYLAIDRNASKRGNTIRYRGIEIAGALHEFLRDYASNSSVLDYHLTSVDDSFEEEKRKQQKRQESQVKPVKMVGGHRLIDPW